jgi:hypothetical protein
MGFQFRGRGQEPQRLGWRFYVQLPGLFLVLPGRWVEPPNRKYGLCNIWSWL